MSNELACGNADRDAFRRLALARVETRDRPNACWIIDSFYRYLADAARGNGGSDLLLRYMGLPHTASRIRRGLRDQWLARAAAHIDAPGAWRGCLKLADEWATLVSLNVWLDSRHDAEPPVAIVSELRRALWWASHYDARTRMKGQPLSARGLFEIDLVTAAFSDRNCGQVA